MVKVKVIGVGGEKGTFSLQGSNSTGAATFLTTYSLAGIIGGTVVDPLTITATSPASGSNVDRILRIRYKDPITGKGGYVNIPSPIRSGTIGKRGERLTRVQAQEALDAWLVANVKTAGSLIAIRGTFVQNR